MSEKDSIYHPSMYDIYKGKRNEVKMDMEKLIIPKFTTEVYKKGIEEKEDLKDEKLRHKKHGNQYQRNELLKQMLNCPPPKWGGIKIVA